MAFSKLIKKTILSPNYAKRTEKVCKITPHHAAGVLTAERLASIFTPTKREASCNYAIGNDGTIIGVVDEDNRAWTSNSRWNDNQAVTIEVSNSATGGNWPVSNAALESLIKLCVDICQRHGMKKLEFTGDKNGSLTMHQMYVATTCPGPYLKSKFPYIAQEVTRRLNEAAKPTPTTKEMYRVRKTWADAASQLGAFSILENAKAACKTGYSVFDSKGNVVYTNNPTPIPAPTPAKPTLKSTDEVAKEVIAGKWGNGEDRKKRLTAAGYNYATIQAAVDSMLNKNKGYKVQITVNSLNVRAGAGTKYKINKVAKKGQTFNIISESAGWGKLSDGSGWIYLKYTKKV